MPISYTVNASGTFAYFTATGVMDVKSLEKVLQEMSQDDRLRPGFHQLFDLTGISNTTLNPESLEKIIALVRTIPKVTKDTKLALVVGSDQSYQNAKHFEKIGRGDFQDIIVFNALSTAKIWLDVDENGTT